MEAVTERPARPARPPTLRPGDEGTTHPDITNIKNYHDEAFLYIQQALSCDEHGQGEQSVVLYQKGLACIAQALAIPTEGPGKEGEQWIKARARKKKMGRTRVQIQVRVDELLTNTTITRAMADLPPSYEVANSPTAQDMEFEVIGDVIMGNGDAMSNSSLTREEIPNAVEIFSIPDGVQIYFITPEGFVSAPSYPSSLGIYRLRDDPSYQQGASNVETPPAFLSVGNWTYPLLPGRSPALHANTGAYIFPDVNAPQQGAAVGVILPDTLAAGEKARLQGLLKYLTDMREAVPSPQSQEDAREEVAQVEPNRPAEETRTSAQISKGIVTAAEWISWGLGKGAEKTGEWLKFGSGKLRERITPDREPRTVDPRTQQGIKYARSATNTAVKVSVFIVEGLGKATMAIGRQVAPAIRRQGEKYLPKSMTDSSGGQSKLDAVAEVAVGGLHGFGTVWLGLESAGKALGKTITEETVSVVKHKYGSPTASSTEDAMHAVGNVALTAYTANNLGIKAIVKRTAKDAGKAVLEDYRKNKDIKTPSPQEDLLPPTLGECKPPMPRDPEPPALH